MARIKAKEKLSNLILTAYATILSRRPKSSDNSSLSALFIPPASGFGSLGDEAMIVGSIQYLRAQGFNKFGLVSWEAKGDWETIDELDEIILLERGIKGLLHFIKTIEQYTHLYCIGADVMDGFYSNDPPLLLSKLATLATKVGSSSNFLGFSFNEHPTSTAVQAISNLPSNVRLCARDPISQERLTQALKRSVNLVADAAFLLQPELNSQHIAEVLRWIHSQRSSGRVVVGFNAKKIYPGEGKHIELNELVKVYADALARTFEHDATLSFLIIPHDIRQVSNDIAIAEAIFNALPPAMLPYCMQVPMPCRAAEIKAFCGELDVVITGRMHLAIACLGQATPVAGITYQGKFEGLFEHFNLDNVTIAPEEAFKPGELSKFISTTISQRQELRQHIQDSLPRVKELAASNFA